jgi:hypothetical protein
MKENVKEKEKIPRPAKGTAGNGFRLQTAMLLQDNKPLYAALHVSLPASFAVPSLIFHSVAFVTSETWLALTVPLHGLVNPRRRSVKSSRQ